MEGVTLVEISSGWVQDSFNDLLNVFKGIGIQTGTVKTKAVVNNLGHIWSLYLE